MKASRHSPSSSTSRGTGSGGSSKTAASSTSQEVAPASNAQANEQLAAQRGDPTEREVYLRQAQAVVDESNARADTGLDPMWAEMNGGNRGVQPDNGTKPAEWRRGVKCGDEGWSLSSGCQAGGVRDLATFQTQLQGDLNFNGVFDEYTSMDSFASACVARYGADAGEPQIQAIAENLWSYAKTGMDVTGNTDVSQLQGLLYALDPMIAVASQSNTTHDEDLTLPGTEMVMPDAGGDEWYGRASMLECRLLSSVLAKELVPEEIVEIIEETTPEVSKTPEDDDVFSRSTFVMDVSSSMYNDHDTMRDYLNEVDFGDTRMAAMTDQDQDLQWHAGGAEVSQDEGRAVMDQLGGVNLRSGGSRTQEKKAEARAISDMFSEIGGSHDESGLVQILELLEARRASGDPVGLEGEQIVVATDESDSSPELIKEVWSLGRELGVLVKILFFTSDGVVIEIPITSLPEDYIDSIYEDSQREGVGVGQFTTHENNMNASTSAGGTHRRLAYSRLIGDWGRSHEAHGGEDFQKYDDVSDRTSRR